MAYREYAVGPFEDIRKAIDDDPAGILEMVEIGELHLTDKWEKYLYSKLE